MAPDGIMVSSDSPSKPPVQFSGSTIDLHLFPFTFQYISILSGAFSIKNIHGGTRATVRGKRRAAKTLLDCTHEPGRVRLVAVACSVAA